MKKWMWALGIVIILGAGIWYVHTKSSAVPTSQTAPADLGTYSYECDEHVTFTLTPASDMSTIKIAPAANPTFPPAITLMKRAATSGVRYEGGGFLMTAHGETVVVSQGTQTLNCSPVPDPNNAPFNFGD